MNKDILLQLIREAMDENLVLKRYQDKLAAVSDLPNRKEQSQETFKNKDKLKKAGFRWDTNINSWVIPQDQLSDAMKTVNAINKVEAFVDKVEDLEEFVQGADNLSKKDELSQKIDGFIKSLTDEVNEQAASEEIRKFMDFQAKLRTRSFHNGLLIWLQDRQATHVEGFRTWETKFGRRVEKGAKAITIFAPQTAAKKTDDEPSKDDASIDDEVKKRNYVFFRPVTVFDVRFTKPIPGQEHKWREEPKWHADNTPNEKAAKLVKYAKQLTEELGIKITQGQDLGGGEQGYAAGDHINIASGVAGVNEAGTLIHEIAHELLHFNEKSLMFIEPRPVAKIRELQAESVSYIVLRHYDLPAKHQAAYLAIWRANKDSIQKNLTYIKKASDFIITKLDEIAKDDVDNNPQPGQIEVPRDK
jgi:hypothetical protein